jgi:hypothetical protein
MCSLLAATIGISADKPSQKDKAAIQKVIDKIPAVSLESYRAKIRFALPDGSKAKPLDKGSRIDPEKPVVLVVTPKEIYAEVPRVFADTPKQRLEILHWSDDKQTRYWPHAQWASVQSAARKNFLGESPQVQLQWFSPFWRSIYFELSSQPFKEVLQELIKENKVHYVGGERLQGSPVVRLDVQMEKKISEGTRRVRAKCWFDVKIGHLRKLEEDSLFTSNPPRVSQNTRFTRIEVLAYNTKTKPALPAKIRLTTSVGGSKKAFTSECIVEEFKSLDPNYGVNFRLPSGTSVSNQDDGTTYQVP